MWAKYIKNEKGQLLPFIAVAMVIMLLFSSFAIAVSMSFRERKLVQDAIDSALLSAVLVSTEKRSAPTRYIQTSYLTDPRTITCPGDPPTQVTIYRRRVYETSATDYRNYIVIDQNKARTIFETYFKLNLSSNSGSARIIDWSLDIKYDNERYLNVIKDLPNLHTANYRTNHRTCGHSYTRTHDFRVTNPSAWWLNEFGGLLPVPGGWTNSTFEEKKWRTSGTHGLGGPVPFPRYVEVTVHAVVEVMPPMGNLLGSTEPQRLRVTAKVIDEINSL